MPEPSRPEKELMKISLGELVIKVGGPEETVRKLKNMTKKERKELLREAIEESVKEKY